MGACLSSFLSTDDRAINTNPTATNQHEQADIFSLGVVLHVLLTGRFPQTGLNQPARIHPSIPDVDGAWNVKLVFVRGWGSGGVHLP